MLQQYKYIFLYITQYRLGCSKAWDSNKKGRASQFLGSMGFAMYLSILMVLAAAALLSMVYQSPHRWWNNLLKQLFPGL
jgi:hypothetical protein